MTHTLYDELKDIGINDKLAYSVDRALDPDRLATRHDMLVTQEAILHSQQRSDEKYQELREAQQKSDEKYQDLRESMHRELRDSIHQVQQRIDEKHQELRESMEKSLQRSDERHQEWQRISDEKHQEWQQRSDERQQEWQQRSDERQREWQKRSDEKHQELLQSTERALQKRDEEHQELKRGQQKRDEAFQKLLEAVQQGQLTADKRHNEVLASIDKLDSRIDKLDSRIDKLDSRIDGVHADVKVEVAAISRQFWITFGGLITSMLIIFGINWYFHEQANRERERFYRPTGECQHPDTTPPMQRAAGGIHQDVLWSSNFGHLINPDNS